LIGENGDYLMNNEGFRSSYYVFDLSIHDIIKPRYFICVAAVNSGIYQITAGFCQIFFSGNLWFILITLVYECIS